MVYYKGAIVTFFVMHKTENFHTIAIIEMKNILKLQLIEPLIISKHISYIYQYLSGIF